MMLNVKKYGMLQNFIRSSLSRYSFNDGIVCQKKNKRNDIRFYTFEPNKEKFNHIKYISKLNNLIVQVFNVCVGNFNCKAKQDGVRPVNSGASSFTIDTNGDIEILKLDSIKNQIMPIGIMHIGTEGWETSVLNSSQNILKETNNNMYIIAKY